MSATLLILVWMAADITVIVTPTNVVITITLPEAQPVQVVTNVARAKLQMAQPTAVLPDARANLPRSVPVPPVQLAALRALPDGTNRSYPSPPPMPPEFPDRKIIWIKDWHGDPAKFTYKALVPLPLKGE